MSKNPPAQGTGNLNIAVSAKSPNEPVTARMAAGLYDMQLPVSPSAVPLNKALQNMAKAINIAFEHGFLENELESVYKAARVRKGTVQILHADYIGLGDGVFAKIGRIAKSIQLTFRGPDPASPQGKKLYGEKGRRPLSGLLNFIGRKLDLIQEFEDQVPVYVEQLLDRLEATRIITGWDRSEWNITTSDIGLDVTIAPVVNTTEKK
ncbi:MAG: hypothetical protein NZM31_07045 [Gemmatales bacterium]|nr:hypothetical protein [Gemmatales bacterium]MDW8386758.1 hypothetical protein [Gemmatales bacterium]